MGIEHKNKKAEVRELISRGYWPAVVEGIANVDIRKYRKEVIQGAAEFWRRNEPELADKIVRNPAYFKMWINELGLSKMQADQLMIKDAVENNVIPMPRIVGID